MRASRSLCWSSRTTTHGSCGRRSTGRPRSGSRTRSRSSSPKTARPTARARSCRSTRSATCTSSVSSSPSGTYSNEVVARGFRAARGRYVALLDGDDYWTSDDKLQAQVAFLDARPDLTICFHNAQVVDERSQRSGRLWNAPVSRRCRACTSSCAGTSSPRARSYRRAAVAEVPTWYDSFFPVTDWPLHVLYARAGRIGYLDRTLGAYRLHAGGRFSTLGEREKLRRTPTSTGGCGPARLVRWRRRSPAGSATTSLAGPKSSADAVTGACCCVACGGPGAAGRRRATGPRDPSSRRRGRPVSRAPVPLIAGSARPRWSVMIPTYNCARYLEATLRSVLGRTRGPSRCRSTSSTTTRPQTIRRTWSRGSAGARRLPPPPREPRCRREPERLPAAIARRDRPPAARRRPSARGLLPDARRPPAGAPRRRRGVLPPPVHGRAGPPARRRAARAAVVRHPRGRGALPRDGAADHDPRIVVRRSVYEQLGGFDDRLACAEDWEMWVRMAARFPVYFEERPLACYRLHDDSNTGRNLRDGLSLDYTRRAIEIFAGYFEPTERHAVKRPRSPLRHVGT